LTTHRGVAHFVTATAEVLLLKRESKVASLVGHALRQGEAVASLV
jgi:hypothetical protein